MILDGLRSCRGKRVLLLQGPLGPFFTRLAADLRQAGAEVYKVNFNGGDWVCSLTAPRHASINFTGTLGDWPAFFIELLERHRIDTVLLFGDCRPIHVAPLVIARHRGLTVGVFEEGYLRPDYITLERGGVNSRSSLPQDPAFYRVQDSSPAPPPHPLGSTFRHAALWGSVYYTAATLAKPVFRHYWHHRPLGVLEGLYWARSFWRKLRYRWKERYLKARLLGPKPDRFFLVPLQTCGDAQIKVHSRFRTVPRFIEHVVRSFARSAPGECVLIIKHHPLDRGYSDHTDLIDRLIARHNLPGRCFYIHDQHLPTLLRNTEGVVVINSTVGLSAVGEGVPVKACGDSIYDMPGLTFQGELDQFWKDAASFEPNMALWRAFRNYLITHTQLNGSFYRRRSDSDYQSGIAWSRASLEKETIPLRERDISTPPTLPMRPRVDLPEVVLPAIIATPRRRPASAPLTKATADADLLASAETLAASG